MGVFVTSSAHAHLMPRNHGTLNVTNEATSSWPPHQRIQQRGPGRRRRWCTHTSGTQMESQRLKKRFGKAWYCLIKPGRPIGILLNLPKVRIPERVGLRR